jgi:hypothetical protein
MYIKPQDYKFASNWSFYLEHLALCTSISLSLSQKDQNYVWPRAFNETTPNIFDIWGRNKTQAPSFHYTHILKKTYCKKKKDENSEYPYENVRVGPSLDTSCAKLLQNVGRIVVCSVIGRKFKPGTAGYLDCFSQFSSVRPGKWLDIAWN